MSRAPAVGRSGHGGGAEDPVRADVERALRGAVDAAIGAPVAVSRRLLACTGRHVDAVRRRLLEPVGVVRSIVDLLGGGSGSAAVPDEVDPPAPAPVAAPEADGVAASERMAAALPIEEYESLAASQVVARLPALTAAELDEVRRFEAAHRGRRTVLGRIDQLLVPS